MRESARTCRDCYFEVFAVLAVKLKCSTVSVILPFSLLLCCLHWPWDPVSSLQSTPVLIKVPKQVDCDMCGLSKILLFSVLYGWQCSTDETGLLLLYINFFFFALCLLLLTWSIAGVACSACHSSGTFFFIVKNTHTHKRARARAHTQPAQMKNVTLRADLCRDGEQIYFLTFFNTVEVFFYTRAFSEKKRKEKRKKKWYQQTK